MKRTQGNASESPSPDPQRVTDIDLAHALGNVVTMLFFKLESLRQERSDQLRFDMAHKSMEDDLRTLKDLVLRTSAALQGR